MSLLPKLPATTIRGPRRLPLLGASGSLIRFYSDPVAQLLSLYQRYGTLAAVGDRDSALICAFGPEYNEAILRDPRRFENFAEVPMKIPPNSSATRLNAGLTNMNGEPHRRHRRMMMSAFSRQRIEGYCHDMIDAVEQRSTRLRPGMAMDIAAEAKEISLCLAMRCLFGLDVASEAEHLGRLGVHYLEGLTSAGAMLLPVRIPGLPYARYLDTAERLEQKLRELIETRRNLQATAAAQTVVRTPQDALSILIDARDDEATSFSEAELLGQATTLFIASHETTAQTLAWTFFLLSQHPRIMNDLSDELALLCGAAPTVADLARLPLLDRVVKESMRLIPAAPFFFMRRATEDFAIGGHELPAGTTLILSSLITHRLPELYPEPRRFLPERWGGGAARDMSVYEYLPLGAGPRMCLGAAFASQAIRLVLAMVLQRCHIELAPEARISRKVQGITLGLKYGLPVQLVERGKAKIVRAARGDIGDLVDL
jgi:cytochrome P450